MPTPEVVIASTTDSQTELDRAAGVAVEEPEKPEPEGAQPEESSERHKNRGFQKRIDGLVKRSREAEDRATAAERRAAELESELNRFKPDASGVTSEMRAEVQKLPHLAGISHFLSTNPQIAEALNAMPAAQAVVELKRMNAD